MFFGHLALSNGIGLSVFPALSPVVFSVTRRRRGSSDTRVASVTDGSALGSTTAPLLQAHHKQNKKNKKPDDEHHLKVISDSPEKLKNGVVQK